MSPEEFKAYLQSKMQENRVTFEGTYKTQLNALLGLSRTEIDAITPDSTDMEVYDSLILLVKEASRNNIQQAQLKTHIEELGAVALSIAGKVSGLVD